MGQNDKSTCAKSHIKPNKAQAKIKRNKENKEQSEAREGQERKKGPGRARKEEIPRGTSRMETAHGDSAHGNNATKRIKSNNIAANHRKRKLKEKRKRGQGLSLIHI